MKLLTTIAALLALALPLSAQEIQILGTHPVRGSDARGAFRGTVTIDDRAQVTLRRVRGTAREAQRGTAAIDQKQLVLRLSKPTLTVRLERADTKTHITWVAAKKATRLTITMNKRESKAEFAKRVMDRPGAMKWLTNWNRGYVDKSAEIARSRQPTAEQVARFARDGGATILSLNGTLRGQESSWRDPQSGKRERVALDEFIPRLGLTHATIGMSASRAPSDAELVKVFRVLLDPTRRPVLMHCKGGSDRTGIIGALYQVEFLGYPKAKAKALMRRHMWAANEGTAIQGAYLDLYQKGTLRRLLEAAAVKIPARFQPARRSRSRRSKLSQPL